MVYVLDLDFKRHLQTLHSDSSESVVTALEITLLEMYIPAARLGLESRVGLGFTL